MDYRQNMCKLASLKSQHQDTIEEDEEPLRNSPYEQSVRDNLGDDVDSLPWHHAQLAYMYGRKVADDIIHPQMEPKRPTGKGKQIQIEGYSGASQLWNSLRTESNNKLLQQDRKIPADLKQSYGAFSRQLALQKGEKPVKRNFYQKEDVPEMEHLLDRTEVIKALDLRHKIELMGRSSKINQDRTNILLHNNPLQQFAADNEDVDVVRDYFPSWMENEDAESVASYQRWLKSSQESQSVKPSQSIEDLVHPGLKTQRPKSKTIKQPQKVVFLTEAEAGAGRGRFSDNYKTAREADQTVENPQDFQPNVRMDDLDIKPFRGNNTTPSDRQKHERTFQNSWEPLTLNALVEYSNNKVSNIGAGDFLSGKQKMFPVKHSSVSLPTNSNGAGVFE